MMAKNLRRAFLSTRAEKSPPEGMLGHGGTAATVGIETARVAAIGGAEAEFDASMGIFVTNDGPAHTADRDQQARQD